MSQLEKLPPRLDLDAFDPPSTAVPRRLEGASAKTETPPLSLRPFLMWPGGKRWLVLRPEFLPKHLNGRYVEPFLGGGALFFHLRPKQAILGDRISELIDTYEVVRDRLPQLRRRLAELERRHCEELYYEIRAHVPEAPFARAVRFLYLNRTCFNGIYRVNRKGEFNVPIGNKPVFRTDDTWTAWSKALQSADLRNADFESLVDEATKGDFIFADPPYTVAHSAAGFCKYNEVLFSYEDQERLAKALDRARRRGARILSTNAADESVSKLYGRGFRTTVVERFSRVAGGNKGRRMFPELIIQAG